MAEEYLYPEEIKRDGWSRYLKNQIKQGQSDKEMEDRIKPIDEFEIDNKYSERNCVHERSTE